MSHVSAGAPAPGAEFSATRAHRLRALDRAHRALWGVVLVPFAMVPVDVVTIGHLADPDTPLGLTVLAGVLVGAVPLLFVLGLTVQGWAERSYAHRHSRARLHPVDWDHPAWGRVRAAFVAAGVDPTRLRAFSVWDRGNLRARHLARPTSQRLVRLADLTVPRQRALVCTGAALGLAAGAFPEQRTALTHTPAFAVLLCAAVVVALPVAWRNATRQVQLNLRDPDNVILIPMHWRPRLRRDATATVQLLHEIAHVRYGDPGNRRFLATCPGIGQALVFFTAAPVMALAAPAWPVTAAFAAVVVLGVAAVRRAVRLIPVVHEVRADAEACRDTVATAQLAEFLRGMQRKRPSPVQAVRLASLTAGALPSALVRQLRWSAALMMGYAAVVGGVAVAGLTGAAPMAV